MKDFLTSSTNNRYLEYLITLQRSLINIPKSKGPKTDPCGTAEDILKGNEKVSKLGTVNCQI
jgi:hypothetical protein